MHTLSHHSAFPDRGHTCVSRYNSLESTYKDVSISSVSRAYPDREITIVSKSLIKILALSLIMCCSRKQQQCLLQAGLTSQIQQLSRCAAQRQQRRELKALAVSSVPALQTDLVPSSATQNHHWTEYQPRTMAGIFVMGVALGLQEGGRKIKEKRDERKAKKAALVSVCYSCRVHRC